VVLFALLFRSGLDALTKPLRFARALSVHVILFQLKMKCTHNGMMQLAVGLVGRDVRQIRWHDGRNKSVSAWPMNDVVRYLGIVQHHSEPYIGELVSLCGLCLG